MSLLLQTAPTSDPVISYGALGAMFLFCGVLIRTLTTMQSKWSGIITAKEQDNSGLRKRIAHLETEHEKDERQIDDLRDKCSACQRTNDAQAHEIATLRRQLEEAGVLPMGRAERELRTRKDDQV